MPDNGPYVVFVDGDFNVPGCACTPDCGMPCWQRVGITGHGCRDQLHEPCPDLPEPEPDDDEDDELE